MSKSNVDSKSPLKSTGERAGSTTQPGGKPADWSHCYNEVDEWVDRLIESDRRMARDPEYRKKVLEQKT